MTVAPEGVGSLSTCVPSISCLMVTRPGAERLAWARRSIDDFCAQTWPDKELVIVVDPIDGDLPGELVGHVAALGRSDIRVEPHEAMANLGALRNRSVAVAGGTLICQWDDDDRHHPQRLERQAECLVAGGLEAVYLQDVLQYFPDGEAMYWTNWRATPATGHPGTLMARRAAMPPYPDERLGEDLAVARAFVDRGSAGTVTGSAYLYLYVSHGANSWHDGHHAMLAQTLSISQALLRRREREIRAGLMPFGLPPGITLRAGNGDAFVL